MSTGTSIRGEAEFRDFLEWCERYRSAAPGLDRQKLELEGVRRAEERRIAMGYIIRENPRRALELAVPVEVQRRLPAEVVNLLEKPVSGRGSLSVLAALAEPGKEQEVTSVFRIARIDGIEYEAYVYGRREGEPSRANTAMNGVALDGSIAIDENAARRLDSSEAAAYLSSLREPRCAISGGLVTVQESPIAVEVAGEIIPICGPAHVKTLNEQIVQAEATPAGASALPDEVQPSAYTEGVKRLLLIRVDFSDLPGNPFPDATGISLISGLDAFYRECSFGKTGFALHGSGSAVTPTFRMPRAASYYGATNGYAQLRSDARTAAAAAGFLLGNYDFDLICFGAVPGWGWAGLGYVGAPGVWLRGYFTVGIAGHELGHNLGLNHANYWDTQGQSVIGSGTSIEYGDVFDTMGSANAGANHFNVRYKAYLNWLTSSETLTVTASGTYRLYAHDDTNAVGVRGIRLARNSSTNYWLEFRKSFSANPWLMNGLGIRWAGNGNQRSHLLDTTPASANGKNDSALVVGRTFSDSAYGIHITPIRRLGTSPDALDVVVNLGTFPTNAAPTVTVAAGATSVAPGGTLVFTAVASDANGDPLAYYWDLGEGSFGTNGAAASKSWNTPGEYLVQCTVSDMKGGLARDSVVVTVGFPATFRISGRITLAGAPLQGARVYVSGSRMTYSDSDGAYTLAGLPASSYMLNVALDGYVFTPTGFANPVSVGPNASGINFDAASSSVMVAISYPLDGAVIISPTNLLLSADAAPAWENALSQVEFYQGTTKLGQDTTGPYAILWTNPATGSYILRAVATDSGGLSKTSAPVSIVIAPPAPIITTQPESVTSTVGSDVTFSITASGGGGLDYQWRYNGTNISGGNQSTLALVNVQSGNAGNYSAVVSNGGGSVTSAVATLTLVQSPTITSQPQSLSVPVGNSATFSVAAVGTGPLRYQWSRNGVALGGLTNVSMLIPAVAPSDAGSYAVTVSNEIGSVTSTAASLLVNCSVILSASTANFTAASGTAFVGVTTHASCGWSVANVPAWVTITSLASGMGNGSITYVLSSNTTPSLRSAILDISGHPYQVTQAAADLSPPVITILAPAPSSTVNEPLVTIRGSASDNVSVARVEYRVGTNSYSAAMGTSSWSADIGLSPGTNDIAVRCHDTSGNISSEVRQSVVCAPATAITIYSMGYGSVRGATNGQRLQIGRRYSLTAIPSMGYVFSNWSGTWPSSSPKVEFEMRSNLVMIANFVPNPFPKAKGVFTGLFYEPMEVHHDRAGFFTFALNARGSYSASLFINGSKLSTTGRLSLDGRSTNQIFLRNGSVLTVAWSALSNPDQFEGTVTDGSWIALLAGDRAPAMGQGLVQPGQFTFVVLGNPNQVTAPGGDGYGTLTVDSRGSARLTGFLADNTRFVVRAPVSRNGQWPCYASLYKGAGAILGWVAFRQRPTTDFDGVLSWARPAMPAAVVYPLGFTSESAIIGSSYERTHSPAGRLDVPSPIFRLAGGNLPIPFTNQVAISDSTIQNLSSNALAVKISTSSGLFSGKAVSPSGDTVTFKGALIPKANFGSGFFLGSNQTGVVVLESSP